MLINQLREILTTPMDVYVETGNQARQDSTSKANALKYHPKQNLISLFICSKYLHIGLSGWKSRPEIALTVQHPLGFQRYELQCMYIKHHKAGLVETKFQKDYNQSLNQILRNYGIPTENFSDCLDSCHVITLQAQNIVSKMRMR